jgi:DUF4097 and DUF4098 domain-containing protein YvlB
LIFAFCLLIFIFMLKRYATLIFGVALVGLGVLFFVVPERSYVIRVLVGFWPLFLILAGLVRVAGHLLDRRPRSPVGGLMLAAMGGILLAANLRGERSFLYIFGRYWFWLLVALIFGRVIRQYTYRTEDGPRPRIFGFGTMLLMLLIVGGGLAANRLSANPQFQSRFNFGRLGEVRDYVFGARFSVEDDPAQSFTLPAGARLVIGNAYGDVEVRGGLQSQASARLIKRIRASSEEEARQAARNIHLVIAPGGNTYQLGVNAEGAKELNVTLVVELPQAAAAQVEVENPAGGVKLADLRGDHVVRNSDRVEVVNNLGRVKIDNPRGAVQLSQIQGEVSVINARQGVTFREIRGAVTLDLQGGTANLEEVAGQVRVRASNAQLEIRRVRPPQVAGSVRLAASASADRLISLDESRNSRISLHEVEGGVAITASRSRIEAEAIKGDLTISSSSERVRVRDIMGVLRIQADMVEAADLRGAAHIEATRDVEVNHFSGPLNVTTRSGAIRLASGETLGGDVRAISEQGRIQVRLPTQSKFRLEASTELGRLRLRGFEDLRLPRNQKQISYISGNVSAPLISLRSTNGNIQVESTRLALTRGDDQDDNEPDN